MSLSIKSKFIQLNYDTRVVNISLAWGLVDKDKLLSLSKNINSFNEENLNLLNQELSTPGYLAFDTKQLLRLWLLQHVKSLSTPQTAELNAQYLSGVFSGKIDTGGVLSRLSTSDQSVIRNLFGGVIDWRFKTEEKYDMYKRVHLGHGYASLSINFAESPILLPTIRPIGFSFIEVSVGDILQMDTELHHPYLKVVQAKVRRYFEGIDPYGKIELISSLFKPGAKLVGARFKLSLNDITVRVQLNCAHLAVVEKYLSNKVDVK